MFHDSLLNETRSRQQCGHELGVEFIDDLALMEERDLVKYLKPIQSRKLMKGIKDGTIHFFTHYTCHSFMSLN